MIGTSVMKELSNNLSDRITKESLKPVVTNKL